jgi:hypothetical protein
VVEEKVVRAEPVPGGRLRVLSLRAWRDAEYLRRWLTTSTSCLKELGQDVLSVHTRNTRGRGKGFG